MSQIRKFSDRIKDKALLTEIARRKLTRRLCDEYLQQAHMHSSKVNVFAFRNDNGGHALYWRNHERYKEYQTTIGPTGIRTIPADPMARTIEILVFSHFWDFLTFLHVKKIDPTTTYIITNGLVHEAAQYAITALDRASRVLVFPHQAEEHDFLAELEVDHIPVGVWGEELSQALMRPDGHHKLQQAMRAPDRHIDPTHTASVMVSAYKPVP